MLFVEPEQETAMDHSEIPENENGCNTDRSLPEIDVSERHRKLQAAAFALLLEEGAALTSAQISAHAGIGETETADLLVDFDNAGRVRFDREHRVVGIAGLSIEPTRHRLEIGETIRWTWCALDAIGILGALGRDATFASVVPGSDQEITVSFTSDGVEHTEAVVFLADGFGDDSVVETWCPTVNLFPDRATADLWAQEHGISGKSTPVRELAADAAALWALITEPA